MALLDTRDIRQLGPYDCGRASALIKLLYYDIPEVEAATMVGRLTVDPDDGTSPGNLAAWFRQERWNVNEGWMDIDTVRHHGAQGRPVILLSQHNGIGHWTVARGVGKTVIYLQDPNEGRRTQKINEFVASWHDADRYARYTQWGLVATPP